MTLKTDYHIHSANSSDAEAPLEAVVAKLKAEGVTSAAITDHIPELPGHVWYGRCGAVTALKKKRDQLEDQYGLRLFIGAEIDVIDSSGRLAAPDALAREFEIVISGVHRYPTLTRPFPNKDSAHYGPPEYYAISEGVLRNPLVTVLAHPGWAFDRLFPEENKALAGECFPEIYKREIMRIAAEEGKYIELNSAEIHLMDEAWFAFGREFGTRYSMGSDAHTLQNIGSVEPSLHAVEKYKIPLNKILILEHASPHRKPRKCAKTRFSGKQKIS